MDRYAVLIVREKPFLNSDVELKQCVQPNDKAWSKTVKTRARHNY